MPPSLRKRSGSAFRLFPGSHHLSRCPCPACPGPRLCLSYCFRTLCPAACPVPLTPPSRPQGEAGRPHTFQLWACAVASELGVESGPKWCRSRGHTVSVWRRIGVTGLSGGRSGRSCLLPGRWPSPLQVSKLCASARSKIRTNYRLYIVTGTVSETAGSMGHACVDVEPRLVGRGPTLGLCT